MADAVILAGGQRKSMRKARESADGARFLDLILRQMEGSAVVGKVIFAACPEPVFERFGKMDLPFETVFSREEEPLGTGGALIKASRLAGTEEILVFRGESFIESDIDDLVNFHRESGAPFTMVLKEVEDTRGYGRAEVNEECRIVSFGRRRSKRSAGFIDAGAYVFERELLIDEPLREASLEEGLLPEYIRCGGYGYVVNGKFFDIRMPEAYRAAEGLPKSGFA
ncbi:MAG: hypothetical protein H3C68_07085 [Deltaproteobacteria bacterium]|nr:hypothetical protein [Deltaproteobacteria bacterium]MBZ0219481.1 hypothetical protein [Deltaproteobacteria bacterium]